MASVTHLPWNLEGPDQPQLTTEQEACIAKLRSALSDILEPCHDDFYLIRFLTARNFDLQRAEAMVRNSISWRKAYGTDDLLATWTPPEALAKHWPGGLFGHDREGRPILWQLCKNFETRTLLKCVKKSDIIKFYIYRMEKVMADFEEQTKKRGQRISKSVHISDLDGLSLRMVFAPGISQMLKHIFGILEGNYPENLRSSYVINAPSIFPIVFNIVKPFLSAETKQKVHILGRDWKTELFKAVDPSEIPVHWGGTATAPDDLCSDHITHFTPVPESLFLDQQAKLEREKMSSTTVQRGLSYNVEYKVHLPGTVIRWVFETEEYDIAFGVYRYDFGLSRGNPHEVKDLEEVLPSTRLNTNEVPEEGIIRCLKPGNYVLYFDNTYSWVNNKRIFYDTELIEPTDEKCLENIPHSPSMDCSSGQSIILETTHL
ncbi:hypothetical protein CAPTEDRAFT_220522 [Capitella teleta]|uniref:CRAL-TRIO domain-containing protein n=1 Tax=Capitella teleta TaxID=283909 RepID=R7TGP6_CAPTE|nr:hypothetical protein CAPTEDRAFT_220522 [Capitella teleta]|eukprot:ELT92854.1 hypothetical protein CAPTEDRAFT_220522 [Capitella teleta]